ncbi:hypothetical protein [Rhodococcus triatomae]|nr:hypothetical protein G419_09051 [Rhodococcus triatomae BKS 15-14]
MDSLVDTLSSQAAPWWAVPVSMIVGVLLGVFAVRRGRPAPVPATVTPTDPSVRAIYVRFLAATDTAHNAVVTVDPDVLAEADLAQALDSDDPDLRALARSIVDLDAMVNELRLLAPTSVVTASTDFFRFLTEATMDGVHDGDALRAEYDSHKSTFVDAVRAADGERRLGNR